MCGGKWGHLSIGPYLRGPFNFATYLVTQYLTYLHYKQFHALAHGELGLFYNQFAPTWVSSGVDPMDLDYTFP